MVNVAFAGRSGSRYRPRSSVTTIFRSLVGVSVVSAITHTPASGPRALVTTPAMSSGSSGIGVFPRAAGGGCCTPAAQIDQPLKTAAATIRNNGDLFIGGSSAHIAGVIL
jgi:hypothetical protein